MKHLHAVIFFDLDNTLVEIQNSHKFFDTIIVDVFDERGVEPPSQEERNKLWRDANYIKLLHSWNYPDPVDFWKKFDNIDLRKRKELYSQGKLVLFQDVLPVLKQISENEHIYIILITNSSKDIVEFELSTFDLNQYFHKVLALGDTQEDCKPNPKPILETLSSLSEEYEFSKNQVFIVGDSPFDVSAGKNADIIPIMIRRKDLSRKKLIDEPKFIIQNLKQLLSIIEL